VRKLRKLRKPWRKLRKLDNKHGLESWWNGIIHQERDAKVPEDDKEHGYGMK